jgi:hypothetical protein
MPIAVMLIGIIVAALGFAGRDQQDVERRTEAISQGQIGLERMTRELRQAQWLYFRSSSVVDIQTPVRTSSTATSTPQLVRYDCSGSSCVRSVGPATTYPPPASPGFTGSVALIGHLVGHDVFSPQRIDATTGATVSDFIDPTLVRVKVRLEVTDPQRPERTRRITLSDGVALRNRSTFL